MQDMGYMFSYEGTSTLFGSRIYYNTFCKYWYGGLKIYIWHAKCWSCHDTTVAQIQDLTDRYLHVHLTHFINDW